MKTFSLLLILCAFASSHSFAAESCQYSITPDSVKVNWSAFKTTAKVEVKGSFPSVKVEGAGKAKKSLKKLLEGVSAKIKIADQTGISTGNPARDQTLFEHFFSLFAVKKPISGGIQDLKGDDAKGTFNLKLSMNGKTIQAPFTYARSEDGKLTAKGGIDVLGFGLDEPFQELHHTCEALHKGPDGVSRTWSEAEIYLTAEVVKTCK